MKQTIRIEYIDQVKYAAIILMILGHCYWKESVPYLNNAIYSFHMPLFFIISGMFLKPLSIGEGLKKYGRAYLMPYVVTALVTFAMLMLVQLFTNSFSLYGIQDWLKRWFFGSGSFRGEELWASTPIVGPIWFLYALFWSCLTFSFLRIRYDGFKLMVVVFALFIITQASIHYIRLPFSIQAGFSAVLFLWIGYLIRKYDLLSQMENMLIIGCLLFIWSVNILKGSLVVSHCVYGLGLISIIGAISASLLIFEVFKKYRVRLLGGGNLGTRTLYILCSHEVFQYSHYIYGNPFEYLRFHPIICLLVEFAAEILVAFVLTASFFVAKQVVVGKN